MLDMLLLIHQSEIYEDRAGGGMNRIPYSINFVSCAVLEMQRNLQEIAIAELQKLIDKRCDQKELEKYKKGEMNDYYTDIKDNSYWMNAITKNQLDSSAKV